MRKLPFVVLAITLGVGWAVSAPSCIDGITGVGGGGGGPDASFFFDGGEECLLPDPTYVTARFEPNEVFLAPCVAEPCRTRDVKIIVDPDFCSDTELTFTSTDETIARLPISNADSAASCGVNDAGYEEGFCINLHKASVPIKVQAGATTGDATITVNVGTPAITTATLTVHVLPAALPKCSGTASTPLLGDGETLHGKAGLAGATINLPKGATKPNDGGFQWHTDPFPATIACSPNILPTGFGPMGPAVTFGPADLSLARELPFSIPINPALMPVAARLRHLRVAYSGPAFKKPRTIPVADPRIENVDGQWALTFQAPRLGTYQAVVADDAGTHSFKRRLTHRAIVGVSMGGGGTAMFGFRHHELFDVLAPLGGPVDWTWMLNYIENNHLAGFRPIAPGTTLPQIQLASTTCHVDAQCKPDETCIGAKTNPPGHCVLMPTPTEPYEHAQTFNYWWYEYPNAGNGGTFDRQEYIQIFRDLSIMFGNPNGENLSAGAENLPAGVPPTDKSVLGDHTNGECKIWVDPISCPDPVTAACMAENAKQQAIANSCPTERCAHTLTLHNYFDAKYNPDGTFPVITVCDGAPQIQALSPWSDAWQPTGDNYPLEVALAVDYNGSGVRDELEPIISQGHEHWADDGTDGIPSTLEPGYKKGVNEDPNGDDYNAQYNPTGTEGDHRYEVGEKFDDFGLDGVKGTKQQPPGGWKKPGDGYDVGEGDGKFTVSSATQRFWDRDPYSIVRQMVDPSQIPDGVLDDDALRRLDIWTDGGTRDLFNFEVAAQNLVGALFSRGRDTAYFTNVNNMPGLDPKVAGGQFLPTHVDYDDLQGIVMQRYGNPDPTQADINDGSGQHVGSVPELLNRIQSAIYFIGSRWQEPELRLLAAPTEYNPIPGLPDCQSRDSVPCNFDFTSSTGRTGPVIVSVPPGYGRAELASIRYPVIYVLHGYGQEPGDLAAIGTVFGNWMNGTTDSEASRLAKAITVYVDGRCRIVNGKAECIRGNFYADSPMAQGSQDEQWFLELIDYMDANYRTMGETEVDANE